MPNAPRPDNRAHTVRVPDPLWEKARTRAAERGETVSEAVRKFLEVHTMSHGAENVAGLVGRIERLERMVEELAARGQHGVALDKGRGIVCLCGEVCNAVIGRSPARIMGGNSDTYEAVNAGTVFARHLRDVNARPIPHGNDA